MVNCKYLLPCGKCDKFENNCSALEYKLEMEKIKYNSRPAEFPPELHSNSCVHDWKLEGRLFGTKSRYTMYVCKKCDEEHTYKTYQDEDGKWITHII